MKTYLNQSKTRLLNALMVCAAIFGFAVYAEAATIEYAFPLSGSEEVPPVVTAGAANCLISLDDVSGAVTVACSFSGLSAAATASHIHGLGGAGVNAGVILALTATAADSGTITGNGILDPAQITGMINGLTYVNLHSSQFQGGELRGQVSGVVGSEPSAIPTLSNALLLTLMVLLLAVGLTAFRRRTGS